MTMPVSVQFQDVVKLYTLGQGQSSLREAVAGLQRRLLKSWGRANQTTHGAGREFAALDHVSFEIQQGESVGFIGANGAGKTTTMKLVSNITRPTRGTVRANGRVSALIELGAGFHPDLSGRENIYFNAAILGMRQREITQRFDQIVEFSGLEAFLDTPVKRYSSGMYCRLGFAVAAHVNPDILIIDEVLAVGDAAFQAKCLKRLSELQADGVTILFVTHNLGYLQRLCQRAIFIQQGRLVTDGPVSDTIQTYRDAEARRAAATVTPTDCAVTPSATAHPIQDVQVTPVRIADVYFTNGSRARTTQAHTGAPLTIHIAYDTPQPVDNAAIEVWLYGLDGTEYATFATPWDGVAAPISSGRNETRLVIDPLCLMPGTYFVNVAITRPDGLTKYDMHWECHQLVVLSGPISHGLVYLPHSWSVE